MLIPARTDTTYFHDYIYGKAEIRFIRGRLRFTDEEGNAADPAPFPSMLVIYNGERVKNEWPNGGFHFRRQEVLNEQNTKPQKLNTLMVWRNGRTANREKEGDKQ